jgi:tetratricopeptide (TPR) repeat protein
MGGAESMLNRYKTIFSCALMLVMLLLSNVSSASDLDREEIIDLYSQAKDFFRQADEVSAMDSEKAMDLYRKSAMRYEKIIKEGNVTNGRIYYNLGNLYFRMKDTGRAILNYRRAQQYIPNDPNLRQNLEFARKNRPDKIEEKQKTVVLKTLFFWHYDISTSMRVMLFICFFVLFWVFAGLRIFMKRSFIAWVMGISAFTGLLLGGSLGAEETSLRTTRPGVIISSETTARKGNSDTYEPSFKEPLHAGTEFVLLENRKEWYYVELPDSRTCWVNRNDVELVR